jgi:hypothetical protein
MVEDFIGFIVGAVIVLNLLFWGVIAMFQVCYKIDEHYNQSIVDLYVDNNIVYKGRGYKVDQETITENLQAPYFKVIIHGKNYWDIEKTFIGKDIKVVNK